MALRFAPIRHLRVPSAVDRALEYWFGYARPPVQRAVIDAGWTPDAPERYCQRCGDGVGPGESTIDGCAACRDRSPIADAFVRLGPYLDELRDWVLAIKYERWITMGLRLGEQLGAAVRKANVIDAPRAVVVPMPMPWQRRLYRGVDHAQLIAAGVAQQLQSPLCRVLAKKHGPPQVTLTPTDRQRLGGRNLRVRRRLGGWPLDGLQVVLVDDVRTTGTTLRRAVRLLRGLPEPPQRIVAAVVAVADPGARHIRRQRRAALDGAAEPSERA